MLTHLVVLLVIVFLVFFVDLSQFTLDESTKRLLYYDDSSNNAKCDNLESDDVADTQTRSNDTSQSTDKASEDMFDDVDEAMRDIYESAGGKNEKTAD